MFHLRYKTVLVVRWCVSKLDPAMRLMPSGLRCRLVLHTKVASHCQNNKWSLWPADRVQKMTGASSASVSTWTPHCHQRQNIYAESTNKDWIKNDTTTSKFTTGYYVQHTHCYSSKDFITSWPLQNTWMPKYTGFNSFHDFNIINNIHEYNHFSYNSLFSVWGRESAKSADDSLVALRFRDRVRRRNPLYKCLLHYMPADSSLTMTSQKMYSHKQTKYLDYSKEVFQQDRPNLSFSFSTYFFSNLRENFILPFKISGELIHFFRQLI